MSTLPIPKSPIEAGSGVEMLKGETSSRDVGRTAAGGVNGGDAGDLPAMSIVGVAWKSSVGVEIGRSIIGAGPSCRPMIEEFKLESTDGLASWLEGVETWSGSPTARSITDRDSPAAGRESVSADGTGEAKAAAVSNATPEKAFAPRQKPGNILRSSDRNIRQTGCTTIIARPAANRT